ncbi:MAG TPA: ergothioneine biosynthesis protein EgtB [Casimicrobiaceae bacterium]|jgi:ergothioneine biosynthesis protein EgtB|nr:ergothioneine biosynthesis protein EgtB [Casimicrobiaceae bacterium]
MKSLSTLAAPRRDAALDAAYGKVRAATEALAAPLSAEDAALQSMADASPVKWHLAHTTWFFETFVLAPHVPRYAPLDPAYRMLFNSYYVAVGDRYPRPHRGLLSRPSLDEVRAYRRHVDAAMTALLAAPVDAALRDVVTLGLNHEEQHQELILTDVKHLLAQNPLQPAYTPAWPLSPVTPAAATWIAYPGGLRDFGVDPGGGAFAFDNEGPRHRAYVAPFALASRPVTNGEFQRFIDDDGYRRAELWLSAGFDALVAGQWQAPLYWSARGGGGWSTFTLHGEMPVDPHAPVTHVSFYEADAYARWAGARLPTEYEWELAAAPLPVRGNFADSGALHPLALAGVPRHGEPAQMFGDVWEWTGSAYLPYPGYHAADGAIGEYNGKFMSGQMVLRGGSCATPRGHVRATYRNFFPPDARWQFSGIRLARDA